MVCEIPIDVFREDTEQEIGVFQEKGEQPIEGLGDESIIVTEITSYKRLYDKPSINGVTLIDDKTSADIHVQHEMDEITNQDIDNIIYA